MQSRTRTWCITGPRICPPLHALISPLVRHCFARARATPTRSLPARDAFDVNARHTRRLSDGATLAKQGVGHVYTSIDTNGCAKDERDAPLKIALPRLSLPLSLSVTDGFVDVESPPVTTRKRCFFFFFLLFFGYSEGWLREESWNWRKRREITRRDSSWRKIRSEWLWEEMGGNSRV